MEKFEQNRKKILVRLCHIMLRLSLVCISKMMLEFLPLRKCCAISYDYDPTQANQGYFVYLTTANKSVTKVMIQIYRISVTPLAHAIPIRENKYLKYISSTIFVSNIGTGSTGPLLMIQIN